MSLLLSGSTTVLEMQIRSTMKTLRTGIRFESVLFD
jgi:hypothetical protein